MAFPDPIAPVIQTLSIVVTPNPNPDLKTVNPLPPPSTWTGGSNQATDGTLYTPLQVVLSLFFGLSSDVTSVGQAINTALIDLATALAGIADDVNSVAGIQAEIQSAFQALQTILGLAQTMAPTSANRVLKSVGSLFQQLENLAGALPNLGVAADEFAELSQQLAGAAPLFPAQA
jgi:hypothetical protein